jgi:hypothetical protein
MNHEVQTRNRRSRCCAAPLAVFLFFVFLLPPSSFVLSSSPPARYTAAWDDGSQTDGETLGPWNETSASPTLDGRALFASPAVRWLLDNTLTPAPLPTARVELVGGDVLPGRVIGVRNGADAPAPTLPIHLLVATSPTLERPSSSGRRAIRVPVRWVQRIVWQPVAQAYRPGVLFARDGRQIAFRAIRFSTDAVRLLVESGVTEMPLGEIAELHFPALDPWDAYFAQLAALAPGPSGRLIRWETVDGLRATGSTTRFQAVSLGADDKPSRWYHMLQPAWSLDPLWVPFPTIRLRLYTPAAQTPLSWFAPVEVRQQSAFGSSWRWQLDRSVTGAPLASGGKRFVWGFGVHARSELQFALHPCVVALHAQLGLDAAAGAGGCVQASVLLQPGGKRLFESPVLVGARKTLATGRLTLDASVPERRLVLLVDPVHAPRPAGADPFDIRDHFDWLEPVLELDTQRLAAEAFQRAAQLVPAWNGWSVQTAGRPGAQLVNHWFDRPADRSGCRLLASAAPGPLVLARSVQVGPTSDRLLLGVSRPEETATSRIEVRTEGRLLAELEVAPTPSARLAKPLEVSLADFHGRRLTLEITQRATDSHALVEWERLELAGRDRP